MRLNILAGHQFYTDFFMMKLLSHHTRHHAKAIGEDNVKQPELAKTIEWSYSTRIAPLPSPEKTHTYIYMYIQPIGRLTCHC